MRLIALITCLSLVLLHGQGRADTHTAATSHQAARNAPQTHEGQHGAAPENTVALDHILDMLRKQQNSQVTLNLLPCPSATQGTPCRLTVSLESPQPSPEKPATPTPAAAPKAPETGQQIPPDIDWHQLDHKITNVAKWTDPDANTHTGSPILAILVAMLWIVLLVHAVLTHLALRQIRLGLDDAARTFKLEKAKENPQLDRKIDKLAERIDTLANELARMPRSSTPAVSSAPQPSAYQDRLPRQASPNMVDTLVQSARPIPAKSVPDLMQALRDEYHRAIRDPDATEDFIARHRPRFMSRAPGRGGNVDLIDEGSQSRKADFWSIPLPGQNVEAVFLSRHHFQHNDLLRQNGKESAKNLCQGIFLLREGQEFVVRPALASGMGQSLGLVQEGILEL